MRRIIAAAFLLLCLAVPAFANDIVRERVVTCWVEGTQVGDMVLGARARLTFVYIDTPMSREASKEDSSVQEWLRYETGYFGGSSGRVLFAILMESMKPMNFDPALITIAGYNVKKEDIKSDSTSYPAGDVQSGKDWIISVAVPVNLKTGETVKLGYGDYTTDFKIP